MNDHTAPEIILLSGSSHASFLHVKSLGISRIAHELRRSGFEVKIFYNIEFFTKKEMYGILRSLINERTLFIGINNFLYSNVSNLGEKKEQVNAMLPYSDSCNQDFKDFVKSCNPHTKIVLGGPKAADTPLNKDFDIVVTGYADSSVVELARHLNKKSKLPYSYRSIHGFTVVADNKAENFNFNDSIVYHNRADSIVDGETLMLEVSRGCIFKCAFCGFPLNGKKKLDYWRDPDQIYQEMIYNFENFQTTRYIFSDDTFNDSEEKIDMILSVAHRLPFQLEYWAYIRLDLLAAKPHTIQKLFDSGLRAMYCGIESWNPNTGKIIGKSADAEKHIKCIKNIRSNFGQSLQIDCAFIVGLPEETIESQMRTFDLINHPDFDIDGISVSPFFLKNIKHINPLFASKITKNFEKYGYEILDVIDDEIIWKNFNMDWYKASELCNYAHENIRKPIGAFSENAFYSANPDWSPSQQRNLYIKNSHEHRYQTLKYRENYGRVIRNKIKQTYQLNDCLLSHIYSIPELDKIWQEFYKDVKDVSWPDCQSYKEISNLSDAVLRELSIHSESNPTISLMLKDAGV